jgi:hypothetical protein
MKKNICLALAALGLSAAMAVPAAAQYSLLLDYSSPDGSAQAAPPQGPNAAFFVRINAVRTSAATNAVVGDMQFRFHYDNTKVDSSGLTAVTAGSSAFYAAAVSAAPTASVDVPGTTQYRTVLVSADPTDAPLSFAVGTNRGIAVGDIAPIAAVGLETTAGFPIDVTTQTVFGVTADPTFPEIARAELGLVYTAVAGLTVDASFLSYDPATDKDGDGRPDSEEGDFVLNFPANPDGTNSYLFDTDADGLSDGLEQLLGLDGLDADSDGDGILDGVELILMQAGSVDNNTNIYDPAVANVYTDTLGDGLPDSVGVVAAPGNPDTNVDSDFGLDGASNAYEVATGYDPADSLSFAPLGDVNNDAFLDLGDALPILDFGAGLVAAYSGTLPFTTRAGVSSGDPAIGLDDALPILDYSGGLADQIR